MIYLVAIVALVVLLIWLPVRYGINGDKNPPPPPPPEWYIDYTVNDPNRDPRNRR